MTHFETDVAIIGAGPVGLFAVHQCGMLGLSSHVFDALPEIGGQCSALYPEKPIYDIPAWPRIDAGDLIQHLETQAAPFKPVYHLGNSVNALDKIGSRWHIQTRANTNVQARAIIIAAGGGAFGPNRPPLPEIESYEDRSVFYMVRKREDFKDKTIVIAGGGDSAVDWAISLSEVARHVHIVHRRAKFRAVPESIRVLEDLASQGKIMIETPYQLKSLYGENGVLTGVCINDFNGSEKVIKADVLLPFFGLSADLGPINQWGLHAERGLIPVEQGTCRTCVAGIYAIGDVASYPDKLKLILTGFADAAQAAHAIRADLYPDREFHFEYSTTKGLPSFS